MELTKHERIVWEGIVEWEQQFQHDEPNDVEMTIDVHALIFQINGKGDFLPRLMAGCVI
ncbi:hypothetical protein [Parageobacillus thermoglucosidasius]|uniref:Uncharacterized protein n=1 Tax=Geobacillus sp. (strain Y4.1MC1) TaxID=581103 RepID=A0A7U3YDC8_GEOS0|nr:hypothetical protein [Parageobacillus thermoglucosidasius]MED4903735.1 hypothetical protein [Parageobacillus thermoglucosidasius]MED4912595.1 hypothetical protein [Parageobacillus thermoglucosidasius]MED4944387.1 hypothetical protein [Parageobacillus thermoglucosidasius]MED4981985.1 hypothetical protein [Parageobacillus thermoglucosidasius]GAJ43731.1 hypothetical protein GT2_11_01070 [Parageobacillus thermoglucosidasius NBRC 107763]